MPKYIVLTGWLVIASDGDTARRIAQLQVGSWSTHQDIAMAVGEAHSTDDMNKVLAYVIEGAQGYI